MQVSQGMFKYPSLPAAINNINFDLKIDCPDGVFDHTLIDMKKLHLELIRNLLMPVYLLKHQFPDPYIDASIKGRIDLGSVKNFMPLGKAPAFRVC